MRYDTNNTVMWKEVESVKTDLILDDEIKGRRSRQTIATLKVGLGMTIFGYLYGWTSPVVELLLSAESPVALTETQVSWVLGSAPLGALLGTMLAALLMDHMGRRGTLMLLNALNVLSWLMTYCATGFHLLFIARLLSGSWIGTCFTIIPNYICEIVDPEHRSFMNTLPCLLQRFGYLAVFSIGTYFSYDVLSLVGWALGLFYSMVLLTVPESPYYYLMVNEKEKASKSLAWFQNNNNVDEKLGKLSKFIRADLDNKTNIFDLLRDAKHLKNVITVTLATVMMISSGGSLIVIFPILIPENSIPYLNNNECSIIAAIISVSFSFRPKFLTPASNKVSLILSGTVCGICMATIALWYYLENKISFVKLDLHWIPVISYLIHIVFFSLYMFPTVTGLRGEMFPTKFKGTLSAFVTTCVTMAIAALLHVYIPIQTHFGSHVNFIIGFVACFSLVLLTHFCIIETEGKSLLDIQSYLNSEKPKVDVPQNQVKKESFVDGVTHCNNI